MAAIFARYANDKIGLGRENGVNNWLDEIAISSPTSQFHIALLDEYLLDADYLRTLQGCSSACRR